ncbi:MAG TPA: hypothetical protein VEY89_02450 [Candidatus Dormibacteraeota bacterium]|nr:hypothetical protein [Candidatus Dormibacteraeota bacterium]
MNSRGNPPRHHLGELAPGVYLVGRTTRLVGRAPLRDRWREEWPDWLAGLVILGMIGVLAASFAASLAALFVLGQPCP